MWSLVHEKRNVSRKHSPKTSVLRTVAILQREPTREFTRVSIGSAFSASAKQMPQWREPAAEEAGTGAPGRREGPWGARWALREAGMPGDRGTHVESEPWNSGSAEWSHQEQLNLCSVSPSTKWGWSPTKREVTSVEGLTWARLT